MSWYYSEKRFSIEKLNLSWNKQTNFNKLWFFASPSKKKQKKSVEGSWTPSIKRGHKVVFFDQVPSRGRWKDAQKPNKIVFHLFGVFQIALRGGGISSSEGVGNFVGREFFYQVNGTEWSAPEEVLFWPFKLFSKLKKIFCKYWLSVKIKISITCVYKEYEVKIKMVQGQWLQLKMKFFNMKIVI